MFGAQYPSSMSFVGIPQDNPSEVGRKYVRAKKELLRWGHVLGTWHAESQLPLREEKVALPKPTEEEAGEGGEEEKVLTNRKEIATDGQRRKRGSPRRSTKCLSLMKTVDSWAEKCLSREAGCREDSVCAARALGGERVDR